MSIPSLPPDALFSDAQKAEIKNLVAEAIEEYFISTGSMTKSWLLTLATIIGSLAVIFGGAKALLGWLGFTYIR